MENKVTDHRTLEKLQWPKLLLGATLLQRLAIGMLAGLMV